MSKTPKMDLYSHMLVPFNVAAYSRTRKHHPHAVALFRALKELELRDGFVQAAASAQEAAEAEVKRRVQQMQALIDQEEQP